MSTADWRALLEALLEGRLSPYAFSRRFMEAVRACKAQGEPLPDGIRDMVSAVEAFEAEVSDSDDMSVSSVEIERAAQHALSGLHDTQTAPRTFDRSRAREEMRRFRVQMSGCAGAGCVIGLVWVALCLLQIIYVSEYVQHALEMSAWPSAFIGFFLAFVPVIGNVLAFLDATEIRHWPPFWAALVFFAAPAITLISGWMRWMRFR